MTSYNLYNSAAAFVLNKAKRLVEHSGIAKPPFIPEAMAPLVNIQKVLPADLGEVSALLMPVENGFIVKVNQKDGKERQNFSCAHEIVHTFFFKDEGKQIAKEIESTVGTRKWGKLLEELCNLGASEILMPFWVFRSYASKYGFSVEAVQPLANIFETSIPATAIRLKEANPTPCYVFFWKLSAKSGLSEIKFESSWASGPKTRISPRGGFFLSLKSLRDKNSGIWQAYHSNSSIHTEECIEFPNFKRFCKVQAIGFGQSPHRYVISLAFPQPS